MTIPRNVFLLIFIWIGLLAGCQHDAIDSEERFQPGPQEMHLTVLAAASLTDSFKHIATEFERRRPGLRIRLNLAGSQQLAQQLAFGAPGDVFASASPLQMAAAIQSSRIDAVATRQFTSNRLIIVVPRRNPAQVESLDSLDKPGLKLVLAAEEVPAGVYTRKMLGNAAQSMHLGHTYEQDVLAQVVSFEHNIRAVLTKVLLGEADAGVVYVSDITPAISEKVITFSIPDPFNVQAVYEIASVKDSEHVALANAFIEFVLSTEGQEILAHYGFVSV